MSRRALAPTGALALFAVVRLFALLLGRRLGARLVIGCVVVVGAILRIRLGLARCRWGVLISGAVLVAG